MTIRTEITGNAVAIAGNDIDTDRIIPARFLKEITFEKMGDYLFHDARFDENGDEKPHPLNDTRFSGASILIVGKNFGCGSSREHAPQAIMRFGIKAIIGESFAEIFAGNCKSIGIPTITASHDDVKTLMAVIENNPKTQFTLDLQADQLWYDDTTVVIAQPQDRKTAFLKGTWNALALLKGNEPQIKELASKLPYSWL